MHIHIQTYKPPSLQIKSPGSLVHVKNTELNTVLAFVRKHPLIVCWWRRPYITTQTKTNQKNLPVEKNFDTKFIISDFGALSF